jgi:hypothetical protein
MGRPEDFYRRLKKICDESAMIPPYGHGRQVHIATKLKVSQEAVRKWFTGDARPRPLLGERPAQEGFGDGAVPALADHHTPLFATSDNRSHVVQLW